MARYGQMWADLDPEGNEDELYFLTLLDFATRPIINCVAIYKPQPQEKSCTSVASSSTAVARSSNLKRQDLNDNTWKDYEDEVLNHSPTIKGCTVLLCQKPPPPQEPQEPETLMKSEVYPWKTTSAQLNAIPLSGDRLRTVAKKFNIPLRFFRPLEGQNTHMTRTDLTIKNKSVQTHSALFKSDIVNYPGNIALVYTYDPERESSCGIFFGCSDNDIEAVYRMIKRSGPAYADPLLLLAVFSELQTLHIQELGDDLMDRAVTVNSDVEVLLSIQSHIQPPWLTKRIRDINTDAKIFQEDIATAQRHLTLFFKCIKEQTGQDYNDKFRERFEQISNEYDDLSGACGVNIGKAILNAETHATVISKHAAKAGVVLAFVAMIYLPLSALASILTIPIFDFRADWRDIHGRHVPSEPSDDDDHPFIVSYYLAHYLGVSLALLLLTLEGWYASTRDDQFEWRQSHKFLLTAQVLPAVWKQALVSIVWVFKKAERVLNRVLQVVWKEALLWIVWVLEKVEIVLKAAWDVVVFCWVVTKGIVIRSNCFSRDSSYV